MKKNGLYLITFLMLVLGISYTYKLSSINAKVLYQSSGDPKAASERINEVRASHILVSTKAEADEIRKEILDGKDFGELAKKYSTCPSKKQGGDLGFFKRGMMVRDFERAAFELPIDEVSEPVLTEFGWHLIKVTAKR